MTRNDGEEEKGEIRSTMSDDQYDNWVIVAIEIEGQNVLCTMQKYD